MTAKRLCVLSVIALLSFYGCTNDSSGGSTPDDKGCTSNSECTSGVCLEGGVCAELVSEGNDCDEAHVCKDDLECVSGKCQSKEPEPPKDECKEDSECSGDLVCEGGKCKEKVTTDPECTVDDECNEGQVCSDGSCKDAEPPTPNDTCETDEDCAANEINTICHNGSCGHYVELGELCDDAESFCHEGYKCLISCIEELDEGAACTEGDTIQVCNSELGLNCYDGYCRAIQENVAAGNECNDIYLKCAENLTCVDGKCIDIQLEDESCDESNYMVCASGLICKDAKCTPLGKECKETSECTEKDSYCCLEESCGAKGHCIPYDEEVTHDKMCRIKPKAGIFEARVQCRWQPPSDQLPNANKVEMHPLVGHFGNSKNLKTTVAFYSYKNRGYNPGNEQAIRIIDPETCETLESFRIGTWLFSYPAAADLDGDGLMEIIVASLTDDEIQKTETSYKATNNRLIIYKWNESKKAHEAKWTAESPAGWVPAVYDIDGDGSPEVVTSTSVFNFSEKYKEKGYVVLKGGMGSDTFSLGNFDRNTDGVASQLRSTGIWKWDKTNSKWEKTLSFSGVGSHTAYADFGTPGATPEDFDFTKLDGYPEYAFTGNGKLVLNASHKNSEGVLEAQTIMSVNLLPPSDNDKTAKGGPITIGDFNRDGLPEIGIASSGYFGVYDPKCKSYKAGECADKGVLWERWSQDASSGTTGSTLFDFDGDGQPEVVYADECFTRVYDGLTGKVLFSARRSSGTSIEAPVVADIDDDGSAEILMGSDNHNKCYSDTGGTLAYNEAGNNAVDPIHEGIRCIDDEDCPTSKNCNKTIGFCTCTEDIECNTQYIKNAKGEEELLELFVCAEPIHADVGFMVNSDGEGRKLAKPRGTRPEGYNNDYKVCRATRKYAGIGFSDLMIFRDRLDRWVSSRNIWNQHAYNIINIEDNGQAPTPAQWLNNWLLKSTEKKIKETQEFAPEYNNYRLNSQGKYGAGMAPDITGRFIAGSICGVKKDDEGNPVLDEEGKEIHVISGNLCNRGTKPVAQNLPATFFYYDENAPDHRGKKICTSYTNTIVGVGECGKVGCQITEDELKALAGQKVLMVSNLDEHGSASTIECNTDNNTDWIEVDECTSDIVIIN
ncbi:MAG: VCBS repeat-containing protein [Proteobacteria bacterium]|nr:VCBS repeat-containing protein [Pseudomonadota bacterium]